MGIWGPLVGGALLIGLPLGIVVNAIGERLGIAELKMFVFYDSNGNRHEAWEEFTFSLALMIGAGLGVLVAWLAGWWTPPA